MDDLSSLPDDPHARRRGGTRSAGSRESQYVVEPQLLNRHDTSSESESIASGIDYTIKTSPDRRAEVSGDREQPASQTPSRPTSSVPLAATTMTQHHQTSPELRPTVTSSQFHTHSSATLSPSNPNNIGSPQRHQQPLHSNAAAVFGPAVKFGNGGTTFRPATQGQKVCIHYIHVCNMIMWAWNMMSI